MPQPLAGPAYPQLQPPFQTRQGNQLLATHERVNQWRNRLWRQEQAEDQMIQRQEAIQLPRQEQQLAEDHQEREIECQEAIRLQVQQHSQHADLRYEELQAQQLIRIQRAAQEELERREDKLADQAYRAARDAVDQGG
ncbi:hypothetical protein SERLA73DRAFT_68051 [Serpula lacrymans var. lacrymans S7.3]|uniref:Uncharacterized protein n=2 Tax=Serpula lacrymans var. lacrymans TaxID=341189 RepID=F8PGL1_SERL3|nr:uncharacterized protein SERLADRAFT_431762 [Serpula lacrymans var. lacrymans S7.9]EGO04355.1 hypothetical protein SERLA73DRAFT_68051 [Serpula lacrymans var. lacrymans S7.3]EGO30263.1 hypothetical protein SERLADRAFT_431762 [Serpula lacrymans var. lacrymans S7.9]